MPCQLEVIVLKESSRWSWNYISPILKYCSLSNMVVAPLESNALWVVLIKHY